VALFLNHFSDMKTSGLFYDHKGSAKAARLSYINNQTEGIERVTFKSGKDDDEHP